MHQKEEPTSVKQTNNKKDRIETKKESVCEWFKRQLKKPTNNKTYSYISWILILIGIFSIILAIYLNLQPNSWWPFISSLLVIIGGCVILLSKKSVTSEYILTFELITMLFGVLFIPLNFTSFGYIIFFSVFILVSLVLTPIVKNLHKNYKKYNFTIILVILIAFITLNSSWPLLTPKISIVYPDVSQYGIITDDSQQVVQTILFEVTPPLFPVYSPYFNWTSYCSNIKLGYDITYLEPKAYSFVGFEIIDKNTVRVCTYTLDGWSINKITIPTTVRLFQKIIYSQSENLSLMDFDRYRYCDRTTNSIELSAIYFYNAEPFRINIEKTATIYKNSSTYKKMSDLNCSKDVIYLQEYSQTGWMNIKSNESDTNITISIRAVLDPEQQKNYVICAYACYLAQIGSSEIHV